MRQYALAAPEAMSRFVRRSSLVLCPCIVLSTGLLRTTSSSGQPSSADSPVRSDVVADITPVTGPSWFKRLGLFFEDTAMGKAGQLASVAPDAPSVARFPRQESVERGFVLTGADLYRLNCQACHRTSGAGVPPEIPTLIDPIRATSAAWTDELMKQRGFTMDPAMVRQMASQAESSLRERILHGGEKMPAFSDHLGRRDVDALLAYLDVLADVPEGTNPIQIFESPAGVGEQVVKGTCRICHDATGQPIDTSAMTAGVIPSLDSFVRQRTLGEVIHKVREGSPIDPARASGRGRMPVFGYLTVEEVTAAYVYLLLYPPGEGRGEADQTWQ